MQLAKPALDLGLYTNDLEDMLSFWQREVGVPFAELLPLGGGLRQHRHAIGATVLKINHARDPLPAAPPAGWRKLVIAREDMPAKHVVDPDGNAVDIVAPGTDGIRQIRVELAANDPAAQRAFYGAVLGLPQPEPGLFEAGDSQIRIVPGRVEFDPAQRARGYRYITLQVFDVRATHAAVLAAGGTEGMAPVKLGEVAHISFVRDADGNWIELSQRKSITGTLD